MTSAQLTQPLGRARCTEDCPARYDRAGLLDLESTLTWNQQENVNDPPKPPPNHVSNLPRPYQASKGRKKRGAKGDRGLQEREGERVPGVRQEGMNQRRTSGLVKEGGELTLAQHSSGNQKAEEDAKKDTDIKVKEIDGIGSKSGSKVVDQLIAAVTNAKAEPPRK